MKVLGILLILAALGFRFGDSEDDSYAFSCSNDAGISQDQCFTRGYDYTVDERFLRYVQIDSASDPESQTSPSSSRQKEFAALLVRELKDLGIHDAEVDEWGYVFATIPSNSEKQNVPTICFCAHLDTSPEVISTEQFPYLSSKIGDDLITASGLTLLGSDDKAGVAVIMDAARLLAATPGLRHGRIRILFTPDEELGRGVQRLSLARLAADYAYTLDGGELGKLEDETFSADAVTVTVTGVSAHPGYAKGRLVNAVKAAAAVVAALPADDWSPETTDGREGFVHPLAVRGGAAEAEVEFIVRDHDTARLAEHVARLEALARAAVARFPGARCAVAARPQYRNMRDALERVPFVAERAERAMRRAGVVPRRSFVRGGTDGALLTERGLPCPNLFAGQGGIHSPLEHVSVQDMRRAVDTLAHLAAVWEQETPA